MAESVKTIQLHQTGRPLISDEQYSIWLQELKPYLEHGHSLRYAIDKASLSKHKTTIYEKLRGKDWFLDKINAFKNLIGELTNESFAHLIETIHGKIINGEKISSHEVKTLKFFALHHKSSTSFFTQKHEFFDGVEETTQKKVPIIQYIYPENPTEG